MGGISLTQKTCPLVKPNSIASSSYWLHSNGLSLLLEPIRALVAHQNAPLVRTMRVGFSIFIFCYISSNLKKEAASVEKILFDGKLIDKIVFFFLLQSLCLPTVVS